MKGLPRPDFIIIGAPKCGTSWLQRVLAQHPSVLMVPDEIEYFSMHLDYPLRWYLKHFTRQLKTFHRTPEVSPIVGEKSARYCSISPGSIRLVHRVLPDVKLVLMTRDPVARHWAQAKRFFSKRRFNKLEGGVLAIPREDLFAFFERMRPLSEFSSIIANWCEIFPPQQLLIVSQEQTLRDPRATFDTVLQHIGAPLDYDPKVISLLVAQKNRGPRIEMPEDIAEFLEPMFTTERKYLQDLFGGRAAVYSGSS